MPLVPRAALPNLWQGSTICNQEEADRDVGVLLGTPAALRFVSLEPMLGPVRFTRQMKHGQASWLTYADTPNRPRLIDWVICGGESRPGARPMQPEWALDVYLQCKAAGVPFWFKQLGSAHKGPVMRSGPEWEAMVESRDLPGVTA